MTNVEHPNATSLTAWRCRVSARCGTSWVSHPRDLAEALDEMDFQRAVQTYLWGYPAVSFGSIRFTAKQDLGIDFNDLRGTEERPRGDPSEGDPVRSSEIRSISERDRSREDKPMIEVPANRRRNGHP